MTTELSDFQQYMISFKHNFSDEELNKLNSLKAAVFAEVESKSDKSLVEKIAAAWPEIEAAISGYLRSKTIGIREVEQWLADFQNHSDKLRRLLAHNELNDRAIWQLQLFKCLLNAPPSLEVHSTEMWEHQLVSKLSRISADLEDLAALASNLKESIHNDGAPRKVYRKNLSVGIAGIFKRYDIPRSGSQDSLQVYLVDKLLETFAAPGEKFGTSRPDVIAANKKFKK